ncbi:MAG: hypothetical protein JSV83_14410, partial [Desulfobacterales bacterium]
PGSPTIASPLSEESFMASHRRFEERDRARELLARPDVQAKVVYHPAERLPACSHPGCEMTLADEI